MIKNKIYCFLSKITLVAFGLLSLSMCAKSDSLYGFDSEEQGMKIHVSLNDVKKQKTGEETSIFVYGGISLKGVDKKIDYVNLKCLDLSIGSESGSGAYVDSTVGFLEERYSANDNGEVLVDVYWAFPESSDINKSNIKNSKIKLTVDSSIICASFK